jgi:beta-galactosidase
MEFWNGWFDHWGEKHHVRAAGTEEGGAGAELETMLKRGVSVNLYMFHGGTNFGFTNGANGNLFTDYAPTVTSYDYDCPLSESGDPTDKFTSFQNIISRYLPNERIRPVAPSEKMCVPNVELAESVLLMDCLDVLGETRGHAVVPPTMDALGQTFGFIHYRRRMEGPLPRVSLHLFQVNDYAQVYLDGKLVGSRMREAGQKPISVSIPPEGAVMDVLVENCGRINYGPYVGKDPKGIVGSVCIELQRLTDWDYTTLPLSAPPEDGYGPLRLFQTGAAFHRAEFTLDHVADTFLVRPGRKGLVWINGFNLGRYWDIGPQETLYVPAPVLKKGVNTVVVLELESLAKKELEFVDAPRLG